MQGLKGGVVNDSNRVVEESIANIGAAIMGRNMFGGHPGAWDAARPMNGWWGSNPPFHHPVFVLTHHPREPLVLEGGRPSTLSRTASCRRWSRRGGPPAVSLAGVAGAARPYLVAGCWTEMQIHLVPILLGSGERLFEGTGDDQSGLELVPSPRRR